MIIKNNILKRQKGFRQGYISCLLLLNAGLNITAGSNLLPLKAEVI